MLFANGSKVEGFWMNGKLCGKATMEYNNGDIYTGEWYNNEKNGIGKYVMCNGN